MHLNILALAVATALLGACATKDEPAQSNMLVATKVANAGGTLYIIDGNQVAFDDRKSKAGNEVASFLIFPPKGDRTDIKVTHCWANNKWTSEVSRKLVTGSRFDVQFNDLNAKHGFGFAAFDNAQVPHAYHYEPLYLSFGK